MLGSASLLAEKKSEEAAFAKANSKILELGVGLQVSGSPGEMPPLNKMHSILIVVASQKVEKNVASDLQVSFDARMPAHNHGMVVKPKVIKEGANRFRVEGVKLHMPGDWEFQVEVKADGKKDLLRLPYRLARQ